MGGCLRLEHAGGTGGLLGGLLCRLRSAAHPLSCGRGAGTIPPNPPLNPTANPQPTRVGLPYRAAAVPAPTNPPTPPNPVPPPPPTRVCLHYRVAAGGVLLDLLVDQAQPKAHVEHVTAAGAHLSGGCGLGTWVFWGGVWGFKVWVWFKGLVLGAWAWFWFWGLGVGFGTWFRADKPPPNRRKQCSRARPARVGLGREETEGIKPGPPPPARAPPSAAAPTPS